MPTDPVDSQSVQPRLKDLLPTRFEEAHITPERIHDLLTREDWQVGHVLTDPSVAANMPCHNCGAVVGMATSCESCGAVRAHAVGRAHDDEGDTEAADSAVCCRHCGTPNPNGRELCLNCGTRAEAEA